jgi:hypothetical protein
MGKVVVRDMFCRVADGRRVGTEGRSMATGLGCSGRDWVEVARCETSVSRSGGNSGGLLQAREGNSIL